MLNSKSHIQFPVLLYIRVTFGDSELAAKVFENFIVIPADLWLPTSCGAENSGFKPLRLL